MEEKYKDNNYVKKQSISVKNLFEKVRSFFPFNQKETKEAKLVGRIRKELQQEAWQVLNQLKSLKESLKAELNTPLENQLWVSIEAIVNPLVREYGQIERKLMQQTDSLEGSTSMIKNYNDWIVKAKLWVALYSRATDRHGIIQAVVIHTKQVSEDLIDRDLKTLHDYKLHEVQNLGLNFQEIKEILHQIDQAIAPHVEGLQSLKFKALAELTLETLIEWKSALDAARTHYYESALHLIDALLQKVAPAPFQEEELGDLREVFERLIYLEEELPIFLGHLKRVDLKEDVTRQMLEGQLHFLEEEIHRLNRDLRLTPELADRVAFIIHELTTARIHFQ